MPIIVKRHEKITYDVSKGRSPDISYFHVFGCPVFIHNYRHHLGKFDEKTDDGFFLGYFPVAKAFRVFNIKRQEMEETYHVTFNEVDEVITQTSTTGDEINFNENRSFPDDEFLIKPKRVIKAIEEEGWVITMQEELHQFKRNNVWTLVHAPYRKTIIRTKQEEWVDYDETFALVARLEAIGIFLAYDAYMGLVVYQMDVDCVICTRSDVASLEQIRRIFLDGYDVLDVRTLFFTFLCLSSRMRVF
ncbi:retrovirus-related pol polyprotein from transposon TNT 1-94 [Tanacetum coccineum]